MAFAERLCEINQQFGYDESYVSDNLFDKQFLKAAKQGGPALETFSTAVTSPQNESAAVEGAEQFADFAIVGTGADEGEGAADLDGLETDEARLLREVDSIRFYIDSGYLELAEKAIGELRSEFGEGPEVEELSRYFAVKKTSEQDEGTDVVESVETIEPVHAIQIEIESTLRTETDRRDVFIEDLANAMSVLVSRYADTAGLAAYRNANFLRRLRRG